MLRPTRGRKVKRDKRYYCNNVSHVFGHKMMLAPKGEVQIVFLKERCVYNILSRAVRIIWVAMTYGTILKVLRWELELQASFNLETRRMFSVLILLALRRMVQAMFEVRSLCDVCIAQALS